MIDNDIQKLDRAASARALSGLEADIWRGVAERLDANRNRRAILSCQAAVLAVALFSSVAVGTHLARTMPQRGVPSVLSVASSLSPASRLTGY